MSHSVPSICSYILYNYLYHLVKLHSSYDCYRFLMIRISVGIALIQKSSRLKVELLGCFSIKEQSPPFTGCDLPGRAPVEASEHNQELPLPNSNLCSLLGITQFAIRSSSSSALTMAGRGSMQRVEHAVVFREQMSLEHVDFFRCDGCFTGKENECNCFYRSSSTTLIKPMQYANCHTQVWGSDGQVLGSVATENQFVVSSEKQKCTCRSVQLHTASP